MLWKEKRRDHIKGSFSDLRDVIPSLNGEKVDDADRLLSNVMCSSFSGVSCSRSQGSDGLHSIDQIEKSTAPEGDRRAEETECLRANCKVGELPKGPDRPSCLRLARLLERVKETGQYTRHVHTHQDVTIKVESELNGIQTTRNLTEQRKQSVISLVISRRLYFHCAMGQTMCVSSCAVVFSGHLFFESVLLVLNTNVILKRPNDGSDSQSVDSPTRPWIRESHCLGLFWNGPFPRIEY